MVCNLRICQHVEIVPIRSVYGLVAMAFHQRFDFTALGFQIVVLDSQRRLSVICRMENSSSVSASMPKRRFDRSMEQASGDLSGR